MIKIRQLLVGVILVSLQTVCFSAVTKSQQLQFLAKRFLYQHSAEEHITALAMTVQSPKQTKPVSIYAGTMGEFEHHKISKQSLFQIGSIGKSFTTAILLKLASDPHNHFNINDRIDKFFPEYHRHWHAITVKELMNMTSGIPDYFWDSQILNEYAHRPYAQQFTDKWIQLIYVKPLLFVPGSRFQYSNTNYLILGKLVEKISGHTLTKEVNDKIIKPLGLKHTFYIKNLPHKALNKNLVHGYQNQDSFLDFIPRNTDVTHYSLSYLGGAGAVISTSEDISKWIQHLFTPGKFLTPYEFKQMMTLISQKTGHPVRTLSYKDPFAFGLGVSVQYGPHWKTAFYIYQGITFGYRAIYVYIPTRNVTAVITVNSDFKGRTNHLSELINQVSNLELA